MRVEQAFKTHPHLKELILFFSRNSAFLDDFVIDSPRLERFELVIREFPSSAVNVEIKKTCVGMKEVVLNLPEQDLDFKCHAKVSNLWIKCIRYILKGSEVCKMLTIQSPDVIFSEESTLLPYVRVLKLRSSYITPGNIKLVSIETLDIDIPNLSQKLLR